MTDLCGKCQKEKPCKCGRHSDYSPEILQTAIDYLQNYEKEGDVVPTIEGLADNLGKSAKTLYNWAEKNVEFQEILDHLISKQGRLLQSKGLKKETDSSITKLLLSANHDKREKSGMELTGKDGGAVDHSITVSFK